MTGELYGLTPDCGGSDTCTDIDGSWTGAA